MYFQNQPSSFLVHQLLAFVAAANMHTCCEFALILNLMNILSVGIVLYDADILIALNAAKFNLYSETICS